MIILAESGSTKTDWCLIDEDEVCFQTKGMNPLFIDQDFLANELRDVIELGDPLLVDKVIFFGAGCATDFLKEQMTNWLKAVFNNADVAVYSDIDACAKAVYEGEPVIACILGTGSNACLYDGTEMKQSVPSLGYILGDEGSGAWFGKHILKDYLYNKAPQTLIDQMRQDGITKEQIIEGVYRSRRPNQFLASFFPYIAKNRELQYCENLIQRGLSEFMNRHVTVYGQEHPVSFTGGVAKVLEKELRAHCNKEGLTCQHIIERPMELLLKKIEKL